MVKNNEWVIPKNIDKPVETVYELKGDEYKVPSFEEFMKTYENDGSLNYTDLESGSVGEDKGYGPCRNTLCGCSCSSNECVCAIVGLILKPATSHLTAENIEMIVLVERPVFQGLELRMMKKMLELEV